MTGVSFIIPTFNSERTLTSCLQSILNQQGIDSNKKEIIVVDGGSTDRSLAIANDFGCVIMPNKEKQQEFAKAIGFNAASQRYVCFIDSDESFSHDLQVKRKVLALSQNPYLSILISGGYITKKDNWLGLNDYINSIGDPFSWFVYGTPGKASERIAYLKKNYSYQPLGDLGLICEANPEVMLLNDLCAGTLLDKENVSKNIFANDIPASKVSLLPDLVISESGKFGLLHNDEVIHDSVVTVATYLAKLRWRCEANLFHKHHPGTGYKKREDNMKIRQKLRKYLFFVYSLSFVGPCISIIRIRGSSKTVAAVLHPLFCNYITVYLVFLMLLAPLFRKQALGTYGK